MRGYAIAKREVLEKGEINAELDANAVARLYLAIHDGLELQKTIDPDTDTHKCAEAFKALCRGNFSLPASEEVKQLDVDY